MSDELHTLWDEPSEQLVGAAIAKLGNPHHRRVFYSQIQNPLWVVPLKEHGAFASVPALPGEPNPPWPEGEYLARMAPLVSASVAAILEPLAQSSNPWVQRTVVEAAAAMPPAYAARLVQAIVDYLAGPRYALISCDKLVDIACNLEELERRRPLHKILIALFGTESRVFDAPAGQAALRIYEYERALKRCLPLFVRQGTWGFAKLYEWTLAFLERTGNAARDGYDLSYISRPSIAPDSQNSGLWGEGDLLIDALLQVTATLLGSDHRQSVLRFMADWDVPLLQRLELEAMAQCLAQGEAPELLHVASQRLLDHHYLALSYRHEYAHLARMALPNLRTEEQTAWTELALADSSHSSRAAILAWLKEVGEPTGADNVQAVLEHSKLRLLAGVGRDSLPAPAQAAYDDLAARHGVPEHADFSVYRQSFFGPTTPRRLDDMSGEAILAYLRSWRPEGPLTGPSSDGLGRELLRVLTEDPERLAVHATALADLDPTHIEYALIGWRQAVEQGKDFPLDQVWVLAEVVSRQRDAEGQSRWRGAQQAAAELAGAFARKSADKFTAELAQQLWRILAPLTQHPNPTTETEAIYGGDNMDPLTLSANTVRPHALRSAAHLLDALCRSGVQGAVPELVDELLRMFAAHIGPERDASLAVAAVFGEMLGVFMDGAPEWVEAHKEAMFGGIAGHEPRQQAWSDVCLSVAVALLPSAGLLPSLRPHLAATFEPPFTARPHTEGWRMERPFMQRVADHLLTLHILGQLEREDPLFQALFSATDPTFRGEALGHLGWRFLHEAAGETVLSRARELMSWRAYEVRAGRTDPAELDQVFWWVRTEKFPPEWWLALVDLAFESPSFEPRGMMRDALLAAAPHYPERVCHVLERLLEAPPGPQRYYVVTEEAPGILAAAMDYGPQELAARATRLMHALGGEGFTDLKRNIESFRHAAPAE